MTENCRAAAARVLGQVISDRSALDTPLSEQLSRVSVRDRPLLRQLCFGTLREYFRLNWVLEQLLKKPLKARDVDLQALLLVGLHQLLDLRTPDHAAIDQTVAACRSLGKPWATGLVNGVLRNCRRKAPVLLSELPDRLALNHPGWLLDAFRADWPEQWHAVVAANNAHPPMCLRVNRQQTSREACLNSLRAAGISASPCQWSADGLRLAEPREVDLIPGFADGRLSVQDEAAQLTAPLLAPAPGERILDACSAPGGKACHLLEYEPDIALTAMDIDEKRLGRVRDNLERLGLSAEIRVGDGRAPPPDLATRRFDKILIDAPCSGTGVIRRHPDIKLLRRPEDIASLHAEQLSILRGVWPLLRPGGCLFYVTCSILPAENDDVVAAFLAECADAEAAPLDAAWGLATGSGRQLLPTESGPDGLYFARLARRAAAP